MVTMKEVSSVISTLILYIIIWPSASFWICLECDSLPIPTCVFISMGVSLVVDRVYRSCNVLLVGYDAWKDLIVLDMTYLVLSWGIKVIQCSICTTLFMRIYKKKSYHGYLQLQIVLVFIQLLRSRSIYVWIIGSSFIVLKGCLQSQLLIQPFRQVLLEVLYAWVYHSMVVT